MLAMADVGVTMTRLLTIVILTGSLAGSIGALSVPGSNPINVQRFRLSPAPGAFLAGTKTSGSHGEAKPRSARPSTRTSPDEPMVVILYSNHPWSWM
jgi:hypothetical protein